MPDLITVVFGGPSPEHDISILTGLQCERILRKAGNEVQCLYWDHGGDWWQVPAETEARDYLEGRPGGATRVEIKLDSEPGFRAKKGLRGTTPVDLGVVLSCFHGGTGEGGGVQALFELLDVPATGSSPYAAALGMDKFAFGAVMQANGIPTLPRALVDAATPPSFPGPYIVKPRYGGSSIGIEVAGDVDTALALLRTNRHLAAGAVVEPFREDLTDFNIAFRTYPELATSLVERPTREAADKIYTYAEKYLQGSGLASAPREIPADIPAPLAEAMDQTARRVAAVTGLTGIVRVDFLSDGDELLFVNEVNSIPGAMALYLWPPSIPAATLLQDMVAEATRTPRVPVISSDGTALRAAGGIAAKLMGYQ